MEKIKINCPRCVGTGQVPDPFPDCGPFADYMPCPGCNGNGEIVVDTTKDGDTHA